MRFILFIFAGLLTVTFFSSCQDEDEPIPMAVEIEGNWEAYSIRRDGTELLGFQGEGGVEQLTLRFSDYVLEDNEGELRITFQLFNQPQTPLPTDVYTINSAETRLTTPDFILGQQGQEIRWDIDNYEPGDQMWLTANINGFSWELRLEKD